MSFKIFISSLCLLFIYVIADGTEKEVLKSSMHGEDQMQLSSPAFKEGEIIPIKFTCDSFDISPKISISHVPENAKSLALICDDPDAPMGIWVHWVIFNLPSGATELPEGISTEITPIIGNDSTVKVVQGINDFRRFGYGGPCPPKGSIHRYYFKLYALDTLLEFDAGQIKKGISADDLSQKMDGHVVATAQLMGKYKR